MQKVDRFLAAQHAAVADEERRLIDDSFTTLECARMAHAKRTRERSNSREEKKKLFITGNYAPDIIWQLILLLNSKLLGH